MRGGTISIFQINVASDSRPMIGIDEFLPIRSTCTSVKDTCLNFNSTGCLTIDCSKRFTKAASLVLRGVAQETQIKLRALLSSIERFSRRQRTKRELKTRIASYGTPSKLKPGGGESLPKIHKIIEVSCNK